MDHRSTRMLGGRRTAVAQALALMFGAAGVTTVAHAGSYEFWNINADTQLQATYAAAMRLHDADDRLIATPSSPEIPLPEWMKLPESNNYDDGNRNFDKGSLVNNRLSFLGEVRFSYDEYGLMLRGDAFYDDVYRRYNDNTSPETINTTQQPYYEFTRDAQHFDGRRARLLDAYIYGSWNFGEEMALNLRLGRQVTAWGESLFFSGIALAQGPADATKATVPGADVKTILLPVNQFSVNFALNNKITLLGQYKLEFKETELNPVGEFFSPADVVGPGREFIYGIRNPLYLETLSNINLVGPELADTIDLLDRLLLEDALPNEIASGLGDLLTILDGALPDVMLPNLGALTVPGTPENINVQYDGEIRPSAHGQYGVGIKYQVATYTNVGLYHLRYHATTPAPTQYYGEALLIPATALTPAITSAALGLDVPVTYKVRYFDGIRMTALSFSTQLFGANIGGEIIYRDGIDVLVDVGHPLFGPVPTPTRANVMQYDLNGLYSFGPGLFWDSFTIVADVGYNHVMDVDPTFGVDPAVTSTKLTNTRDAAAVSTLLLIDKKNVFSGWDLNIPIFASKQITGQSAVAGGFGSLMGEQDWRFGTGINMTYLQAFTIGLSYSGFYGRPDVSSNPYADRDNVGLTATYRF